MPYESNQFLQARLEKIDRICNALVDWTGADSDLVHFLSVPHPPPMTMRALSPPNTLASGAPQLTQSEGTEFCARFEGPSGTGFSL
jgi:hypothetical protein